METQYPPWNLTEFDARICIITKCKNHNRNIINT